MGNDVWIGDNVVIIEGVKVGDGAIIGASAIVTKDVEPYSIVGGVSAKLIRYRFDEEKIAALSEIKWWKFHPSEFIKLPVDRIQTAIEMLRIRIDDMTELYPCFKDF